MKNTCHICGKEISFGFQCYKCKEKEDRGVMYFVIGTVLIFSLLIFGIRVMWAKYVFHDWRCALSECRIIKN